MTTTFEPDPTIISMSVYVGDASYGAWYALSRTEDHRWLLSGGERPELQGGGLQGDTWGELLDLMVTYAAAITASKAALRVQSEASDAALATELAAILPQPPPG